MLRHIVLFKIKPEYQNEIPSLVSTINSLKGKIGGMLDLEAGADVLGSSRSYDIALMATFTDQNALDAYQTHPLHLPISERMGEVRESVVACDYLIDEPNRQ